MEARHPLWSPAPKDPVVADRDVHVWRAPLERPPSLMQGLRDLLTEDEVGRAYRFTLERDRQRFIAARGTLRSILGRYMVIDPALLRFSYNQYGKPCLAAAFRSSLLNFNLSHSGGMALYAITRQKEIGVDVEQVCPDVEYEEIAKQFFSGDDAAILRTVPTGQKLEVFYRCWTRKEAYIKAYGIGLDSLDVPFAPWHPPVLSMTSHEPQERSLWTFLDLKPAPGYIGALAVKGIGCRFRYWDWCPL